MSTYTGSSNNKGGNASGGGGGRKVFTLKAQDVTNDTDEDLDGMDDDVFGEVSTISTKSPLWTKSADTREAAAALDDDEDEHFFASAASSAPPRFFRAVQSPSTALFARPAPAAAAAPTTTVNGLPVKKLTVDFCSKLSVNNLVHAHGNASKVVISKKMGNVLASIPSHPADRQLALANPNMKQQIVGIKLLNLSTPFPNETLIATFPNAPALKSEEFLSAAAPAGAPASAFPHGVVSKLVSLKNTNALDRNIKLEAQHLLAINAGMSRSDTSKMWSKVDHEPTWALLHLNTPLAEVFNAMPERAEKGFAALPVDGDHVVLKAGGFDAVQLALARLNGAIDEDLALCSLFADDMPFAEFTLPTGLRYNEATKSQESFNRNWTDLIKEKAAQTATKSKKMQRIADAQADALKEPMPISGTLEFSYIDHE